MAFKSGVVPENWRSAVIATLYKGKGERPECKNYRGISLLRVVGKMYAGILVDRVSRCLGWIKRREAKEDVGKGGIKYSV